MYCSSFTCNYFCCIRIYHGPKGILQIANRTSKLAKLFSEGVKATGFEILSDHFFDTVTIKTKDKTKEIYQKALAKKINLRNVNNEMISVAFDEAKKLEDVNTLLEIFGSNKKYDQEVKVELNNIPSHLKRTSKYLTHPVFNKYQSETEMLRYLKRLEDSDIALNRSMIALGSCTMKLNATCRTYSNNMERIFIATSFCANRANERLSAFI